MVGVRGPVQGEPDGGRRRRAGAVATGGGARPRRRARARRPGLRASGTGGTRGHDGPPYAGANRVRFERSTAGPAALSASDRGLPRVVDDTTPWCRAAPGCTYAGPDFSRRAPRSGADRPAARCSSHVNGRRPHRRGRRRRTSEALIDGGRLHNVPVTPERHSAARSGRHCPVAPHDTHAAAAGSTNDQEEQCSRSPARPARPSTPG